MDAAVRGQNNIYFRKFTWLKQTSTDASLVPSGYCRRALSAQLAELVRSSGSIFAFTTRSCALIQVPIAHIASLIRSLVDPRNQRLAVQ
jgi:hypothetical protein